jgi:hypothetical protein
MFKISLPILLLAGIGVHPVAQAAINWDFTPPTGTSPIYANYSTTRATITAFATGTSTSTSQFAPAQANSYGGGVGITNTAVGESTSSPNHAIDNVGGFEFALFRFTDIATGANVAATLNSLAIGWNNNGDADVSVLAYTGAGTPTVTGKTISNIGSGGLLGSGWTLVANLADMATGDNNAKSFNALNRSSSYWLVGAYLGYGSLTGSGTLSAGNDYFKISGLGGTFTTPPPTSGDSVPEPSSLLMLSLALLGWRRYMSGSRYSMAF